MLNNVYSIPIRNDLLDKSQQEKYFTKLDLKSWYHQVQLKEEDTWQTTFRTKQGLYEWLIIPFSLCNAKTIFMRLMNAILRLFIFSFVIFYLDDTLVYSATWEENISQAVWVCVTIYGLYEVFDWWRRAEDISFQDRGHHEIVGLY